MKFLRENTPKFRLFLKQELHKLSSDRMGAETTSVSWPLFPLAPAKAHRTPRAGICPRIAKPTLTQPEPRAAPQVSHTEIQTRATIPTKFHKVLGKTRHLPKIKIKVQPFQYRTAGFCLRSRVFLRHSRGNRSPHPCEHYGVAGHHRDTLCITCAYLTA